MIEKIKASVLRDIEIAENEGFIPTGLATLYLLTVVIERLDDLADEQRQTAQTTLATAKANADLAQTKAKQAKEPPPPMPVAPLQKVPQNGANGTVPPTKAKPDAKQPQESWYGVEKQSTRGTAVASDLFPRMLQARMESDTEEHHTGMMLAFLLDPETAAQLALPNGEPASELHITLAYLGDMEDKEPDDGLFRAHTSPDMIRRVLTAVTSAAQPLSGKIAGIGRFTTQSDEDTPTPIIATVDVPGLSELRTELVEALEQASYFVADTHGYTPHITLAYIDKDADMPVETVPPLPLLLDTVTLVIGDERIAFKLGGDLMPPTKESHEEQNTQEGLGLSGLRVETPTKGSAGIVSAQGLGRQPVSLSSENRDTGKLRNPGESRAITGDRVFPGTQPTESARVVHDEASHYKVQLADRVASLFEAMKQRGSHAEPTSTTALLAYSFTDKEREKLAQLLAVMHHTAQLFAYDRDIRAVGLVPQTVTESLISKANDLLSWGHVQVASIVATMQEQLSNFLSWLGADAVVADAVSTWLDNYVAWKAPQIANVAWGAGANEGSMAAITDMIDAATDPNQPALLSTDNIRIRVVPAESSSDFCRDYAGKDYSIDEYLALGKTWPAHPNCIHSIEAYIDDSSDLAGGNEA